MLVLGIKIYMSVAFPGFEGAKALIKIDFNARLSTYVTNHDHIMLNVVMPRLKCHIF
jgi:hypothetical protein